ncbi:hypothetical protein [Sphingobium yanoikuyae]|uniref:hypothetical protein n=1 Tax=Sphingobium yanoikuyae TaxID=13690 RepID=UPI0022DD7B4D|nr:hypothetical protein [Sphingobium yanoikuyae]WBQ18910.1 hypothetical protein PAE53_05355 [Sphingobium yanoikuyae]
MNKEVGGKPVPSKTVEMPAIDGGANAAEAPANPQLDPEIAKKIATLRSQAFSCRHTIVAVEEILTARAARSSCRLDATSLAGSLQEFLARSAVS